MPRTSASERQTATLEGLPTKGNDNKYYKTQFCRYFPECAKGAACPYAHAHNELQERPKLAKTALCNDWRKGQCPFDSNECKFAHGPWELQRAREALKGTGKASRSISKKTATTSTNSDYTTRVPTLDSLPSFHSSAWSREVTPENFGSNETDDFLSFVPKMATPTCPRQSTRGKSRQAAEMPSMFHEKKVAAAAGDISNQAAQSPFEPGAVSFMDMPQPTAIFQQVKSCHVPVLINVDDNSVRTITIAEIAMMTNATIENARSSLAKVLRAAEPEYYSE